MFFSRKPDLHFYCPAGGTNTSAVTLPPGCSTGGRRRGSPTYSTSIPPRLRGTSRQPRTNKCNQRGRLAAAAPGRPIASRLLRFDLRGSLQGRNFCFVCFATRVFFLFFSNSLWFDRLGKLTCANYFTLTRPCGK